MINDNKLYLHNEYAVMNSVVDVSSHYVC